MLPAFLPAAHELKPLPALPAPPIPATVPTAADDFSDADFAAADEPKWGNLTAGTDPLTTLLLIYYIAAAALLLIAYLLAVLMCAGWIDLGLGPC